MVKQNLKSFLRIYLVNRNSNIGVEDMKDSKDLIKKELNDLIKEGNSLLINNNGKYNLKQSPLRYQKWYTASLSLVRQLLPDRIEEFEELYQTEKRKEIDITTYGISDYLLGIRVTRKSSSADFFDHETVVVSKFFQQLSILASVDTRIDSVLSDVMGVLRADLFDNEIDAAESLLKAKHLRAAGTVAGVVLESHLAEICNNNEIKLKKKNPTIDNYNQALKDNGILDLPNWRQIQRLGDIRNYCSHKKERDPTYDEVEQLIKGVNKIINTIF